MTKIVKDILEIARHRNGVSGQPFWAVRFIADANDDDNPAEFLAILTDTDSECYVLCVDLLAKYGVSFGQNSWRGDHFETELREAIKACKGF